jgi:hypothetical protein
MHAAIKAFLFIAPSFVAGLFSGLYGPMKNSEPASGSSQCLQDKAALIRTFQDLEKQKSRLQTELSRIAEVDLAEYLRLRKEEEQFQKAKVILGKVFLLLFHNILTKVPQEQLDFARAAAGQSASGPGLSDDNPAAAGTTSVANQPMGADKDHNSNVASNAEPSASTWNQAEKDLAQLAPDKVEAFLESTVIKDIRNETHGYRKFKANDSRIAALQGSYSGEIVFLDPKKKPWQLEMTFSGEVEEGIPKGNFSMVITNDRGGTSNSSGSGSIRGIMKPVSDSKAIIIRVGDTQFFQMYLLENREIIIGNFYDEKVVGQIEHLGRFRLQR